MTQREEFLRYAEQCVRLAEKTDNSGDRARFLQMAQAWRELAAKISNFQEPPEKE
jgi:hypothetical protein